jgi:hypothetical protein
MTSESGVMTLSLNPSVWPINLGERIRRNKSVRGDQDHTRCSHLARFDGANHGRVTILTLRRVEPIARKEAISLARRQSARKEGLLYEL